MNKAQNNTAVATDSKGRETITKHTVRAFDYITVDQCGYRVVARPCGGKPDGQPSHAVLQLVHTKYNDEGRRQSETIHGLLMDGPRVMLAAWTSAAQKTDSSRTWNKVTQAVNQQWKSQLTEGAGLSDAVRIPLQVKSLVNRCVNLIASMRNVDVDTIDIEDAATMAKTINPAIAGYIADDGTYRKPKEVKAKTKRTRKTATK